VQFLEVTVGSVDLAFVSDAYVTASFAFPQPVERVHCALQGFDLAYPDADHHLRAVHLEPRLEFDPFASATAGQVRVHFIWRDDGTGLGSGRISTFFVRLLLIGE
jgi:hypothetical protein